MHCRRRVRYTYINFLQTLLIITDSSFIESLNGLTGEYIQANPGVDTEKGFSEAVSLGNVLTLWSLEMRFLSF